MGMESDFNALGISLIVIVGIVTLYAALGL